MSAINLQDVYNAAKNLPPAPEVYLGSTEHVYAFDVPRGKMFILDDGARIARSRAGKDAAPWSLFRSTFEDNYRFKPVCVMHPEDFIGLALTLKQFDAALEATRALIHHRIDSGYYVDDPARFDPGGPYAMGPGH